MPDLKIDLNSLKKNVIYQSRKGKKQRGYDFERFIFDGMESEGLEFQRPYKATGEQIDGGIYIDGNWYLVEIKWHSRKLPVSEVYSFKGKVDGKLTGTRGLFISWSGYSKECADALALGKEQNIILFDANDVEIAAKVGWYKVIQNKIRFAALYGENYATPNLINATQTPRKEAMRFELFAEGEFDSKIYKNILIRLNVKEEIILFPCEGKTSAIRMSTTLPKGENTKRILILDTDGNPDQDEELSSLPKVDLCISVDPMIEALLDPENYKASIDPHEIFRVGASNANVTFKSHISNLIERLIKKDEQGFIEKLLKFFG